MPGRLDFRLALLAVALCGLAGCHRGSQPLELRGPAMGTTYSVIVTRLPEGVGARDVQAQVTAVLADADRYLSGWNDASEVARFNANRASGWQPVSATLLDVVSQAHAVSVASGGAFDITVAPLVGAWGFGAGAPEDAPAPAAAERQRLLARVGFGRLELRPDPPALRKTVSELELDLDGIAPGWAVDRIAERLEALGVRDYLVELGGEVRGGGHSPSARPWRVAVEAPLAGARRPEAVIEIGQAGVSTSGDYREFREVYGRRISHTIDPRTGEPVGHGLAAVTVVCGSVAEADAWATAFMVLGRAEGLPLAERLGLAALFIERGAQPGEFVESETPQFARLRLPGVARL